MNSTPCYLLASMLLAASAQAQTNACDQLKDTLAARIEATGVRGYSLETAPASTPVPRDAKVIGTCEAGAYKVLYRRWGAARPSPASAAAATPASAPSPTPRPVSRPTAAASAAPTPIPEPEKARASEAEVVRVIDRAVAPPVPAQPDKPVVATPPQSPRSSGFIAENWRWLLALALLPIAAGIWAWRAHRSAYDEAGLPRGPKLTL